MSARIALMLPRFSRYGGVEGFGYRLARDLAALGHHVDYICARAETPAPAGVTLRIVGRHGLVRSGKMLWFALQAERLRRRGNYDVSIGLGKSLQQDLLRVGGGPLTPFWRLSERAWSTGLPRFWKKLRRRSSPANRLTLAIEKQQYAGRSRIVAVSHAVAAWIVEAYPTVRREDIQVIYNEPDKERFFPLPTTERDAARIALRRAAGAPSDVCCIGIAGSNFRLKGLAPLINALALLPDDIHLLIAGGRSPEAWQKKAASLGLHNRVHFLGKVDAMPAFYQGLDAFALPSFYDACANAVLEAVACGIPTVSSAANGSSIILPEEHVVTDPTNVDMLAHSLEVALSSPPPQHIAWPENTARGMEPWITMVQEMADTAKRRGA